MKETVTTILKTAGHRSPQTTMIYLHVIEVMRRVANLFDSL